MEVEKLEEGGNFLGAEQLPALLVKRKKMMMMMTTFADRKSVV